MGCCIARIKFHNSAEFFDGFVKQSHIRTLDSKIIMHIWVFGINLYRLLISVDSVNNIAFGVIGQTKMVMRQGMMWIDSGNFFEFSHCFVEQLLLLIYL